MLEGGVEAGTVTFLVTFRRRIQGARMAVDAGEEARPNPGGTLGYRVKGPATIRGVAWAYGERRCQDSRGSSVFW